MPLRQFIVTAIFTAIETYFFNEAIMSGTYLIALFWGLLVLRNLQVAFVLGKIVDAIEDQIKKRKK